MIILQIKVWFTFTLEIKYLFEINNELINYCMMYLLEFF